MILILRGKRLGFTLREIKEYLDLYGADADAGRAAQVAAEGGAGADRPA